MVQTVTWLQVKTRFIGDFPTKAWPTNFGRINPRGGPIYLASNLKFDPKQGYGVPRATGSGEKAIVRTYPFVLILILFPELRYSCGFASFSPV